MCTEWKEGDAAVVRTKYRGPDPDRAEKTVVTRLTKTQVITPLGRFSKKNGRRIPQARAWHDPLVTIEPLTTGETT